MNGEDAGRGRVAAGAGGDRRALQQAVLVDRRRRGAGGRWRRRLIYLAHARDRAVRWSSSRDLGAVHVPEIELGRPGAADGHRAAGLSSTAWPRAAIFGQFRPVKLQQDRRPRLAGDDGRHGPRVRDGAGSGLALPALGRNRGGAALLFAPLPLQPLPDSFVNGRRGCWSFASVPCSLPDRCGCGPDQIGGREMPALGGGWHGPLSSFFKRMERRLFRSIRYRPRAANASCERQLHSYWLYDVEPPRKPTAGFA